MRMGVPDLQSLSADEMRNTDRELIDPEYVKRYEQANPAVVNLREALESAERAEWIKGIDKECRAVDMSWGWEVPPAGARVLPSRLILCLKDDGRYKARVVVIGFLQWLGASGGETYAPALSPDTFRLVMAISSGLGEDQEGADVSTAFLLASIGDDVIYVEPPRGWIPRNSRDQERLRSGHKWRLTRALYGLKKAPRYWSQHFDKSISADPRFVRCPTERCLYLFVYEGAITFVVLYVDDLIFAGKRAKLAKEIVLRMFPCRDLGQLAEFLGMQIERDAKSSETWLHMRRHVEKFVAKYGIAEKGVAVPLLSKVDAVEQVPAVDDGTYLSVLGSTNYLATSLRFDIAFAQGHLGRFGKAPTVQSCAALQHFKKYIAGTAGARMIFRKLKGGERWELKASADSDWKGTADGKSTGGHIVSLSGVALSWSSKLMTSRVMMSSTEAEFAQLASCAKDVIFFQNLFAWFGKYDPRFYELKGTPIEEDNKGAVDTCRGSTSGKRIRHLDHNEFFARDMEEQGRIGVKKVGTDENSSDIMTKPVASRAKLDKALENLNLRLCSS